MSATYRDFNRNLIEELRANSGSTAAEPFKDQNLLILTTTGAKSKQVRESPLMYSRDGAHFVIVASKGGAPTHPAWYHNLRAHPIVTVEVGGDRFQARAHVAEGEEYERLYKQHADMAPVFHGYRTKTSRRIPVIVLERIAGA